MLHQPRSNRIHLRPVANRPWSIDRILMQSIATPLLFLQSTPSQVPNRVTWVELDGVECFEAHPIARKQSESIDGFRRTVSFSDVPFVEKQPENLEHLQVRVDWGAPRDNGPGCLEISGHIAFRSTDIEDWKSPGWMQGVRVYVSNLSQVQGDQIQPLDQTATPWADAVVSTTGEFRAYFDPALLHRSVGEQCVRRLAAGLANTEANTVSWQEKMPIPSGSQSLVKIDGPRPLQEYALVINSTPLLDGYSYDPVAMIRVANFLIGRGKLQAISDLEAFLRVAGVNKEVPRRAANIDTADREIIPFLIQLIFQPEKDGPKPPPLALSSALFPRARVIWNSQWLEATTFPFVIIDDIPFLCDLRNLGMGGGGGPVERIGTHLAWAKSYGVLRGEPFSPSSDPFKAVDVLLTSAANKDQFTDQSLREGVIERLSQVASSQALRCLCSSAIMSGKTISARNPEILEGLRRLLGNPALVWSTSAQEFVATH